MSDAAKNVQPTTTSAPDTTSMTLSSGQKLNPLRRHLQGQYVPNSQNQPRAVGKVGTFFNAYLTGTSGAGMGWTGGMVAEVLCAEGFIRIAYEGKVYEPGSEVPEAATSKGSTATYEQVEGRKIPDRNGWWKLVSKLRDSSKYNG